MSSYNKMATAGRRVFTVGIAIFTLALLFLLPLQGQTTPPAPTPSEIAPPAPAQAGTPAAESSISDEPTFKTHVDEVSLDLVVHDKHRKPVLNLQPEDLTVMDGNSPVKLEGLHLVRGGTAHGHLVTLVFDQFVGPMAKQARQVSEKVLKVLPEEGYSIAVLNFGGRLRLMQPFTADRKLVEKAIQVITDTNAVELNSTLSLDVNIVTDKAEPMRAAFSEVAEKNLITMARKGVDASGQNIDQTDRDHALILLNALQDAQKIAQEQHTYRTLAGLMGLVKAQQRAPERKAIIYITRNRDLDTAGKAMIKNIAAAATKASVTFYTVDLDAMNDAHQYDQSNATFNARAPYDSAGANVKDALTGRVGAPLQQQGGAPIQGVVSVAAGPIPIAGPPNWGPQQDIAVMTDFHRFSGDYQMFEGKRSPMVDLSLGTGGIYIDASNNLKHPLQQMAEDLSTYYEATYTPPFKEYDGSYREIAVHPLRKNLRIETKSGYYALPPGAEAGLRPFEVPLMKIMDSKTAPSDVKFHASVLRFGEMPDGATSTLAIEVPVGGLQIKEDTRTNLYLAHATVEARIRDSKGVQIERVGEDLNQRGALQSLDRDPTLALELQRHFICAPGHYTLEVAVIDQLSGKSGMQSIPFEVLDSSQAGSLSDMVLVRNMADIPSNEDDPVEPLRYGKSKVTANISGEVPADAKKVSLFLIVHPDPAAKDDPRLDMQIIRNGKPGKRMPLPLRMDAPGLPMPYLASFGSGRVAPGNYEVVAYLTQGGKTTQQKIAFKVDGKLPDGTTAADPDPDEASMRATQNVVADLRTPGQLTITPVTSTVQPLAADEAKLLVEDARHQALTYSESLPNFICIQMTKRSYDNHGYGEWKLRDDIVEQLRYVNKTETRSTLEVNGKTSAADRAGMKGALSAGEFGGVLLAVFSPTAKATFQWKETDSLNSGVVQVFAFNVDKANSMFTVTGSNDKQMFVGFHGQVYIDSATRSVRRITLIADDMPKDFPTHATRIDVDYDYVAINNRDFLVPVSAEMRLVQGRHQAELNTMEFRNYRHYGSDMKILPGYEPVAKN